MEKSSDGMLERAISDSPPGCFLKLRIAEGSEVSNAIGILLAHGPGWVKMRVKPDIYKKAEEQKEVVRYYNERFVISAEADESDTELPSSVG